VHRQVYTSLTARLREHSGAPWATIPPSPESIPPPPPGAGGGAAARTPPDHSRSAATNPCASQDQEGHQGGAPWCGAGGGAAECAWRGGGEAGRGGARGAGRADAPARASKVSLGAWVWKALQRPAASAVGRGAQRQRVPRVRLRVRTAGQAERKRNMQPGTQGGCARPPPPLRGILMARVQKVPDSGCEFVASPWAAMLCCEANRGF